MQGIAGLWILRLAGLSDDVTNRSEGHEALRRLTIKSSSLRSLILEINLHQRTMTAQDKVKQTAREEAQRVADLARDAAQSGAYFYPIKVSCETAVC